MAWLLAVATTDGVAGRFYDVTRAHYSIRFTAGVPLLSGWKRTSLLVKFCDFDWKTGEKSLRSVVDFTTASMRFITVNIVTSICQSCSSTWFRDAPFQQHTVCYRLR